MKLTKDILQEEARMLYRLIKELPTGDESKIKLIYMHLQEVDKRAVNRIKFRIKKGKANEKV